MKILKIQILLKKMLIFQRKFLFAFTDFSLKNRNFSLFWQKIFFGKNNFQKNIFIRIDQQACETFKNEVYHEITPSELGDPPLYIWWFFGYFGYFSYFVFHFRHGQNNPQNRKINFFAQKYFFEKILFEKIFLSESIR